MLPKFTTFSVIVTSVTARFTVIVTSTVTADVRYSYGPSQAYIFTYLSFVLRCHSPIWYFSAFCYIKRSHSPTGTLYIIIYSAVIG